MSEQVVRDAIRFTKGSVVHVAGKKFTAEELRDGLDRLIHPPTPDPEPVVEAEAEAEPEPAPPKAQKPAKKTKRKTGGRVEHL